MVIVMIIKQTNWQQPWYTVYIILLHQYLKKCYTCSLGIHSVVRGKLKQTIAVKFFSNVKEGICFFLIKMYWFKKSFTLKKINNDVHY